MTMVIISSFFDFLKTLPSEWTTAIGANTLIELGNRCLPFFSYGFGWIVPTILGFLIGAGILAFKNR